MAEAAKAVSDYIKDEGKQIIYITVMNALSLSCERRRSGVLYKHSDN